MSRIIKYRGQRVDNKEWVYGLPQYLTEYGKDFKEIDGIQCDTTRDVYDVIPETVGQFTGLNDCKGVDIYEGDILYHLRHECKTTMTWDINFCCFSGKEEDGTDNFYQCDIDGNKIEVIGNIHNK